MASANSSQLPYTFFRKLNQDLQTSAEETLCKRTTKLKGVKTRVGTEMSQDKKKSLTNIVVYFKKITKNVEPLCMDSVCSGKWRN